MTTLIKHAITPSLAVVATLLATNAPAQLNMSAKEHTPTIVWVVEAVTFITAIVIVVLVWHISKRDRKTKNEARTTDQD